MDIRSEQPRGPSDAKRPGSIMYNSEENDQGTVMALAG